MYTLEQLVNAGGNEWRNGDKNRVYFNNLSDLYGLEILRYNSGSVMSAKLDGRKISNSAGAAISGELNRGKLYYDMTTGKFMARDIEPSKARQIIDAIKGRIV